MASSCSNLFRLLHASVLNAMMMASEVHLNILLLMFINEFFLFSISMSKWNFHLSSRPRRFACVGSQIFQAWRKFMDEIEQQSKQIRFNAEQLENLCSDRMAQLYQDKRKSRKQYQEEHAKVASQFAHVSYWEHLCDLSESHAMHQQVLRIISEIPSKFQSMSRKNNFKEWARKFHLFIWTWWLRTDTLEPHKIRAEH